MNKTIYLRDEEGPIWERARELAGDKLSPVIVAALKRFIAEEESKPRGFERIVLEYNDSDDLNLPKRKAFYGQWVFPKSEPLRFEHPEHDEVQYFCIALTAKGAAVFFSWRVDRESQWDYKFRHRGSLEVAAAEMPLNGAARAAIEKIGVPTEELDI
jgi:hypothetical protein